MKPLGRVIRHLHHLSGGNEDIRVSIAQFDPDPAPLFANWTFCYMKVYDVNPVTNKCRIRIWNRAGFNVKLKGTLYLTSIPKD